MSLLLAAAAAIAAQSAPATLTLGEAQALSPEELATRVLGMAGSVYREARVSGGERGAFGASDFASIDFAGPSRSAGFPRLCVADRLFVSFTLIGGEQAGPNRRMRLQRLDANSVYRIVGDTNDRREGTDASERAEDAQCARAGPVLADGPGTRFFGSERLGSADAYMAARMLQTAIAEARRGPVSHVTCTEDSAAPTARACVDPRSVLAGLSTNRLRQVELDRCAENATHLCADLNFEHGERRGNEFETLRIIIEADVSRSDPPPDSFRVLAVIIRHETWIED